MRTSNHEGQYHFISTSYAINLDGGKSMGKLIRLDFRKRSVINRLKKSLLKKLQPIKDQKMAEREESNQDPTEKPEYPHSRTSQREAKRVNLGPACGIISGGKEGN